jgi:predicted secreted acid phosphatase
LVSGYSEFVGALIAYVCRGEEYNDTTFDLWVENGTAPAVPAILQLFNALKAAKFGVVFLTGRSESQREITTKNLYGAGYKNWTELILK